MWGCNYSAYFPWMRGLFPGNLFSLLIWGVMILALVYLAMRLYGALKPASNGKIMDRNDSLEILKTRFAQGEIDQEAYLRMKKILGRS